MGNEQILNLSIMEINDLLLSKRLSSVELVKMCFERIREVEHLNAFITLFEEQAMEIAAASEKMIQSGYHLTPLHGVPIALKDNIDMSGSRTTAGSYIMKDHVSADDAFVTRQLKKAGAIIIGKTNMHEFAWGGTTNNPHYGTCRNPWDPMRIPAGSSGGSGVAVATRSCFGALGTDTGGSVRLPAALNGVSGIRPTIGRVSNHGVVPVAWTMDTVGPLAKSIEDCAILLDVMTGYDPEDLESYPMISDQECLSGIHNTDIQYFRIGIIEDYTWTHLQPQVKKRFEEAVQFFEEAGCLVEPVKVEHIENVVDAQVIVDACEPSTYHLNWLRSRPGDYGEDVRVLLEAGSVFSATQYIQAQRYRTQLREQLIRVFQSVDVIISPTVPFTAPLIDDEMIEIDGIEEQTVSANMRFTSIPSMAGLPAISIPCGFDDRHLPVGMQVMAAPFQEKKLVRVGHAYQKMTKFHKMMPGYDSFSHSDR